MSLILIYFNNYFNNIFCQSDEVMILKNIPNILVDDRYLLTLKVINRKI